jgi:predicted glutamine amidotransferase
MISKISVEQTGILEEMLRCPYSLKYLSENGRQPGDADVRGLHHDGCGMAFSKNGTVEIHKRPKEKAWDESYQQLARTATSRIFIAHNRLASQGLEMNEKATHPFSTTAAGKTFALCHNGGIRTYMEEARQAHTSDSFIFLRKLIDPSGKNDKDSIFQRLADVSRETSYGSLCAFLLSDSELFVWRIYSESEPARVEAYEKYYTLYMTFRKDAALFSSEPLDESPWMLLPNNSMMHLQVKDARIVIDYHVL